MFLFYFYGGAFSNIQEMSFHRTQRLQRLPFTIFTGGELVMTQGENEGTREEYDDHLSRTPVMSDVDYHKNSCPWKMIRQFTLRVSFSVKLFAAYKFEHDTKPCFIFYVFIVQNL